MAMTIKEAVAAVRTECGPAHTALVMAFATITERIRRLPPAEQDDLYTLMKELPGAANDEELDSIMTAGLEILEQAPSGALRSVRAAAEVIHLPPRRRASRRTTVPSGALAPVSIQRSRVLR
jgi:hypothetical protein